MTMEQLIDPFGKYNKGISQEAAIFLKEKYGFSMHFDTSGVDDSGRKTQAWYSMAFKKDFIETLQNYGRLPYHSYVD